MSFYKHPCAGLSVDVNVQCIWVNTKEHGCWMLWQKDVCFFKKLSSCLPMWPFHLAFLPATNESSSCSTYSKPLVLLMFWILATSVFLYSFIQQIFTVDLLNVIYKRESLSTLKVVSVQSVLGFAVENCGKSCIL